MASISDVGRNFIESGMRLISQTNSDHLLNDKIEKEPMPVVIEQSHTMEEYMERTASTPREKYIFAVTQLQNAAKLLGGELVETAIYDHTGQASNRFSITYTVENRDDIEPYDIGDPPGSEHSPTLQKRPEMPQMKRDYEGPLYAKHPDLAKEEPPFDTEAYRHFKEVQDV